MRKLNQSTGTRGAAAKSSPTHRRRTTRLFPAITAMVGLLLVAPQALALPVDQPAEERALVDLEASTPVDQGEHLSEDGSALPADEVSEDSGGQTSEESGEGSADQLTGDVAEDREGHDELSDERGAVPLEAPSSAVPSSSHSSQLDRFITVGIGTKFDVDNSDKTVELDKTTLGANGDWTANVAITNEGGHLEADEARLWADQGVVSRLADPAHKVEASRWYPEGSTSYQTLGSGNAGYVQDVAAMDALNAELAAMKLWVAGLEVDASSPFSGSNGGTINVDNYDTNGDGIAVIALGNPNQHYKFKETTINITGSGDVLPIFLVAPGVHLDFEETRIRLRGGLSDATPAGRVGALFVQLAGASAKEVFEFSDESQIDRIGFYDLTLDPRGDQRIYIDETTGCGQFVGALHRYKDSNLQLCSFGGPPAPPEPAPNTAEIRVYVGSDRIAGFEGDATPPAAGVTLRLAPNTDGGMGASSSAASAWQSYDWATCESDADGWCTFEVPIKTSGSTDADGMRNDARPHVVGVSAPTGWSLFDQWSRGSAGGVNYYNRFHFVDKTISAGDVIESTSDPAFMRKTTGGQLRSFGQWATIRDNPVPAQMCAIDVAFVVDVSSSISPSELVEAKLAMDASVDALTGTDSRVALFSFDGKTPGSSLPEPRSNYPGLRPVLTASEADAVKGLYADWVTGGGTNWDAAQYAVADAEPVYDVVMFLTDGDPTWFGTMGSQPAPGGGGSFNATNLEAGIFSSNLVKSQGTRVVGFGVGEEMASLEMNLAYMTGPQVNDDFFVAPNYREAGQQMVEYLTQCNAIVDVQKRVIDEGETAPSNPTAAQLDAISSPAPEWEIHAEASDGGAMIPASAASQETDAGGSVTIPMRFTTVDASGSVTITEAQQDGFEIVPVGGDNLVCTDAAGDPVPVENAGTSTAPGATLTVANTDAISCVIYNQPEVISGEVTWEKVDAQGNHLGGSEWKIVGPAPEETEIGIVDCVADEAGECTGTDRDPREGHFLVTDLVQGRYELIESKAPAGFVIDDTPRPFVIGGDGGDAALAHDLGKIENRQMEVPSLPLTGGMGEQAFWLAGLILAVGALGGAAYQRSSRTRSTAMRAM